MRLPRNPARYQLCIAAQALLAVVLGCQAAAAQQAAPSVRIDLDQAVQIAVAHNHR